MTNFGRCKPANAQMHLWFWPKIFHLLHIDNPFIFRQFSISYLEWHACFITETMLTPRIVANIFHRQIFKYQMVTLHSVRNKIWIELNLFENDRSQFPLLMRGLNLMLYFFLFWTACNWRWPLSNSANKTMRIALFELSRSFSIGLNWNCRRIWCEHIYCNCIFIAIIILNSDDDHRLFNFSIQAMWMGHVYGHIESTQFNCSVCWIDITFARFTFVFVLRTFWVTTYLKGHDCSVDNVHTFKAYSETL